MTTRTASLSQRNQTLTNDHYLDWDFVFIFRMEKEEPIPILSVVLQDNDDIRKYGEMTNAACGKPGIQRITVN